MIERYKMQFVCLCLIVFISILFFSAKAVKNRVRSIFGVMLINGIIYTIFDMITVYTVNHLETVHPLINRICHEVFIITLDLELLMISVYLLEISGVVGNVKRRFMVLWNLPFIISTLVVLIVPIEYATTPYGNYSVGMGANTCYFSVAFYLIASMVVVIRKWRTLESRRRNIIFVSLCTLSTVSLVQAIFPTVLLSSFGLTIIIAAIYLSLENTDRVLLEQIEMEKKRADEANRAKSNFLANMSHEIRTPINAILGMDEMILRESKDKYIVEYATDIQESGKNLLSLVNGLLDFSKIESGKMELNEREYDMGSILYDVVLMMHYRLKEKNLQFISHIDYTTPSKVIGDAQRVKQILINLLNNAIKYTDKGSVTLNVKYEKKEDGYAYIYFGVEDTGIGIKEENLAGLFEQYKRFDAERNQNVEGTGLGLSITHHLLELMGSELKVESRYNEGSNFYFVLKQKIVSEVPMQNIRERFREARRIASHYKEMFHAPEAEILLVDDNIMNLKVIKALLKETKVQVDCTQSGREALEMIQKKHYDVIFLDHMMPDLNGVETFRMMKEMGEHPCKDTPIIVLTANAIVGARAEYLEIGFDDFLPKPVDAKQLEAMLMRFLPEEKVLTVMEEPIETGDWVDRYATIEGFNMERVKEFVTSDAMYQEIFADYIQQIPDMILKLDDYLATENIKEFTVLIHGIKSNSRMIGAEEVADMAERLEAYGKKGELEQIKKRIDIFISRYMECGEQMTPYVVTKD